MNTTATSRWVTWPGYLAVLLFLMIPASVLVVRAGAWQQGLMLYAVACLISTLVLIYFVVLLLLPKFAAHRGTLFVRAIMVAIPAYLLLSLLPGRDAIPAIHDISTDIADPPVFTAAPAQRGEGSNPIDIKPEVLAQQAQAYADLATLQSPLAPAAAFERALAVAEALGWEVYRKDAAAGEIEAVDTTALMAFKDDIILRLRPSGSGTEVDMRSISRVGRSDMGKNAARIREFQARFVAAG